MQWDVWSNAQRTKVDNCLGRLEPEAAQFATEPTIGEIAVGCALAWLDFRMPDIDWRDGRSRLTSWYEKISSRSSLQKTAPKA
jgi:glutathione S-transferase